MVDIRFGRDLMPNWQNIIHSVDAKIASWGRLELNHLKSSRIMPNTAFQGTRYSGLHPLPLAPELRRYAS